ncbi:MAG: DUF1003 domain-containing protein, partial [Tepidiformaceae bacterium]
MEETSQRRDRAQEDHSSTASLNAESTVVEQNIEELAEARKRFEESKSLQDRGADLITRFSGSMLYVYLHIVWFAAWIIVNLGWVGLAPFDEFPFGLLTMIVSLEAIFLSTFVLISQNRSSALSDKRADLDLQINLLAEREATKLLKLLEAIAEKVGVSLDDPELEELKEDVNPRQVMDELERRETTEDKRG